MQAPGQDKLGQHSNDVASRARILCLWVDEHLRKTEREQEWARVSRREPESAKSSQSERQWLWQSEPERALLTNTLLTVTAQHARQWKRNLLTKRNIEREIGSQSATMPLRRRPIWSYQLHISFYLCPSSSNENISLAPHFTHIQIFQTYFQGTKWTVRGSDIWLRNYCKHIAKSISNFRSPISPWWGRRGSLSSQPKILSLLRLHSTFLGGFPK